MPLGYKEIVSRDATKELFAFFLFAKNMTATSQKQRCYFTLLDSESLNESINRLRRANLSTEQIKQNFNNELRDKLQAAVLLHDEVVFRATAVFASSKNTLPFAREVINNALILVENGVLVPEVRGGDELLAKQLRDNSAQFGLDTDEAKSCLLIAEAIDAAPKKHEPDAVVLSQERSLQLIDHLFQLYCHRRQINFLKNKSVSCADLDKLFTLLLEGRPVARNEFNDKCKLLYKIANNRRAEHLVQTIYYGVGALTAQADAFLPEQLNQRGGLYPKTKLDELPKNLRKLADKFGINERLARPQNPIIVGDNFIQPDEILSELGVSKFKEFEWSDILALNQSGNAKRVRGKIYRLANATNLEQPLGLITRSHQDILDSIRKAKLEEGEMLKKWYSGIKDAADILPVALPSPLLLYDPKEIATYLTLVAIISTISSWIGATGVIADRLNIIGYFTPFESFKNKAEKIERKYY